MEGAGAQRVEVERVDGSSNEKSVSTSTSKRSLFSVNSLLTLTAIAAGATHGYCDSQGMPISGNASNETILTYGPTALRAGVSGIKGAFVGAVGGSTFGGIIGGAAGSTLGETRTGDPSIKGAIGGGALGAGLVGASGLAAGGALAGTLGAFKGGLQTLVGYGVGYIAGAIAHQFQ